MTTAATARPIPMSPPRAVPPAAAPMAGAIDPIRLFKKYWAHLAVATFLGAALGLGGHFALRALYPIYTSRAVFQCSGPQTEVGAQGGVIDEDELERFMATQVAIMTGDRVLQRATRENQAKFLANAPKWSAKFKRSATAGGDLFVWQEAALELQDSIRARVEPGTTLISLSMGWTQDREVAAIVGLVRESYIQELNQSGSRQSSEQIQALNTAITDLDAQIRRDSASRTRLLEENKIDSIENRTTEVRQAIAEVNSKLVETLFNLEAATVQLNERERDRQALGAADTYPEDIRQQVEAERSIQALVATINAAEARLNQLRAQGIGEKHRERIEIEAALSGNRQKLEEERERLMLEKFNASVEQYRLIQAQLQAQKTALESDLARHQGRLVQLTTIQAQLTDLQNSINQALTSKNTYEARLKELQVVRRLPDADRVSVVQQEQVPTEVTFPKWYIMLPAGVFVVVGLVGGLLLTGEILDQRVRGPSDIALIPRTRVLGMIPHASEDPTNPPAAEMAFKDAPKGVLAESYRALRGTLAQRLSTSGARSLLVVSAMPASGGTSVIANIAQSFAAADRNVLVIDANFRRPALHRIFKVQDAPGLGDVLTSNLTLARAVQPTSLPNLTVLSAGSAGSRRFESLSSERMTGLLAEAGAAYDLVLIDVAPAVVSGDAVALANRCDAVVLVVRALSERRGMVARLRSELSDHRAEFLGVVLNAVRSSAGGYFRRNILATHDYQASA